MMQHVMHPIAADDDRLGGHGSSTSHFRADGDKSGAHGGCISIASSNLTSGLNCRFALRFNIEIIFFHIYKLDLYFSAYFLILRHWLIRVADLQFFQSLVVDDPP